MTDKMPYIGNRTTYAAVQRALKSIWYGETSPVAEAAEWAAREHGLMGYWDTDSLREHIETALAQFAGLIVEALPLPDCPTQINQLASWHVRQVEDHLLRSIKREREKAAGLHIWRDELARLRQEIEDAQRPAREAAARVKNLKQHRKALETREARLHEQIAILTATVNALEASVAELQGMP